MSNKKEFNLSRSIRKRIADGEFNLSSKRYRHGGRLQYNEEDIKEFIKLLKERVKSYDFGKHYPKSIGSCYKPQFPQVVKEKIIWELNIEINKLAGEKLCQK